MCNPMLLNINIVQNCLTRFSCALLCFVFIDFCISLRDSHSVLLFLPRHTVRSLMMIFGFQFNVFDFVLSVHADLFVLIITIYAAIYSHTHAPDTHRVDWAACLILSANFQLNHSHSYMHARTAIESERVKERVYSYFRIHSKDIDMYTVYGVRCCWFVCLFICLFVSVCMKTCVM